MRFLSSKRFFASEVSSRLTNTFTYKIPALPRTNVKWSRPRDNINSFLEKHQSLHISRVNWARFLVKWATITLQRNGEALVATNSR